jgi:hypothetical protein
MRTQIITEFYRGCMMRRYFCRYIVLWLAVMMFASPLAVQAATPLIWFGPEPPLPLGSAQPYMGSIDYLALLSSSAKWEEASAVVHALKINTAWIEKVASEDQLRNVFANLARAKIKVALEMDGLRKTEKCGKEGFSARDPMNILKKLKAAGGTVDYIVLNEPFAWGSKHLGEGSCRWAPERVAQELKSFITSARSLFPNVKVGDVEPLWQDLDSSELIRWVDLFAEVTGTGLAFFHLDVDYKIPDWAGKGRQVEEAMRGRGIPFGIQYFGNRSDTSDAQWLDSAARRVFTYETSKGGRPDHALIQSWHRHPNFLLPETDPTAFTAFLLRYAKFEQASPSSASEQQLLSGAIRAGAYVISGIVPPGATEAVTGFQSSQRASGRTGPARFDLHSVRYLEGSDKRNRVVNGDFSRGSGDWNVSGKIRTATSMGGGSRALAVTADGSDSAVFNSSRFPVMPGSRYVLEVDARIYEAIPDVDVFRLVFLSGRNEIERRQVPLISPK